MGRLFEAARQRGVLTIGVGDPGNEIGMGAIADTVKRLLPYGAECQCSCAGGVADATEVDVVVPGTCSNWGAYGQPLSPAAPITGMVSRLESAATPQRQREKKIVLIGSLGELSYGQGRSRCARMTTQRSPVRRRTKLIPRHRPSHRAVADG